MPGPVILAFGVRPERLLDTEGRIECFLEPPRQEQLDLLVQTLRDGTGGGGGLIAIVPDWFDPAGVMRLQMALSLVDRARVAMHVTALPPLAATVLASLAAAAGCHVSEPGVLASVLTELEAELHVITWLGSVSGLSSPAAPAGQRLASAAAGSAFVVSSFPEPAVHRLHGRSGEVPLPLLIRASRLAVSDHGGDAGFILGPVAEELGSPTVVQVPATPEGARWWGTSELVEAVAYPEDAGALVAELLIARDTWRCRWCGQVVACAPCPICGQRL